jgi:hypothetical protein
MPDEGVVAEAQDTGLRPTTGTGRPFHLGGITPCPDREGVPERVNGKRFLEAGVASVPARALRTSTRDPPHAEAVGRHVRPWSA